MSSPSTRPGMGALLHPGGDATAFRVWAPFATSVSVAGGFNGWSTSAHPLGSEGNGYWSADVPGARAGDQYRYVMNGRHWRIDPRALAVTNSVGNGLIVDSRYDWQHAFQAPPWNEMVVYEMHARTFPDNPTGTETLFDELLSQTNVDYLRELGINTLLMLPAAEFPGDVSWGYNPAHIFAIESSYGGPRKFKEFVDRAHGNGLAVLLDVVYNHFGPSDIEHSVWQFDGWHQESDGPTGGIYFYNDWRARTPWGQKNRPDYGRGDVRQFIRDNALMWLEEYHVDGLRFDMTVFMRNVDGSDGDAPDDARNLGGAGWSLLQWINDEIDGRQPWKITMAEDLQGNARVTKDTGAGGMGFDAQWDARFVHPVRRALVTTDDAARDMDALRFAVGHRPNGSPWQRVVYTESHDEVAASNGKRRLPEDIHPGRADSWESKKRSTLGAALVFTSAGIPMIFQGQEILEWIPFADDAYGLEQVRPVSRDLHALSRPDPAAPQLVRQHARPARAARPRVSRRRRRQGAGVPPLGPGRPRRRRGRGDELQLPDVSVLHHRLSARRRLARAVQFGLERLQPRLRQHLLVRHHGGRRRHSVDAVFGERGDRALLRDHRVAVKCQRSHARRALSPSARRCAT